jgi:hypothetical protein
MAKGYRICKVCGEQYEYCHTEVPAGLNRWQDVACCPEHAAIYFEEIARARGEYVEPIHAEAKNDDIHEDEVDDTAEFDGYYEEAFENEEDDEDM